MSRLRAVLRRPVEPSYRYVFVLTYGRSGSTLVQGLLNTLPRTLVRGENNLYLLSLFRAWAGVERFREVHLGHNPRASHSAFYGLHEIDPDTLVQSARQLVTTHLLGSEPPGSVDVLGFKEVLWHRVRSDETEGFFHYLDLTFPGCRFVLNTRDHENVVGSGFWQGYDLKDAMGKIKRIEELQDYVRTTRPDRALDLQYELLTSPDPAVSDAQLRALAVFAHGSCDDELLAQLRQTRETGHGPFPFGKSRGRAERRQSDEA